MADKVSNVSAGVGSARQASAASGAGGGRKDDKRDGRKPPRKNPSRVGKSQTAKRCYNCRQAGHLQKDCPLLAAMSMVYHMLQRQIQQQQQQPVASGQPRGLAGPGPSRRRRQIARQAQQRGQEDVPPQRENQLDPSGENGADPQKSH
ncbi:hypothetical protein ZTR_08434 [Talaromyces verruculosus]|nr:hypothetical protein ZTR_08434 [Talaromyces verruculosus]